MYSSTTLRIKNMNEYEFYRLNNMNLDALKIFYRCDSKQISRNLTTEHIFDQLNIHSSSDSFGGTCVGFMYLIITCIYMIIFMHVLASNDYKTSCN